MRLRSGAQAISAILNTVTGCLGYISVYLDLGFRVSSLFPSADNLFDRVVQRMVGLPARVVRRHLTQVAVVANVIAYSILFYVGIFWALPVKDSVIAKASRIEQLLSLPPPKL